MPKPRTASVTIALVDVWCPICHEAIDGPGEAQNFTPAEYRAGETVHCYACDQDVRLPQIKTLAFNG